MNFQVFHLERQHGKANAAMEREEDRTEQVTINADPEKRILNFTLFQKEGRIFGQWDNLKWSEKSKQERIEEILGRQKAIEVKDNNGRTRKKKKIRKDAVTHISGILSGSHDRFQNMDEEDIKSWAAASFIWLGRHFGGIENIVTFNVHMDERTPHIHWTVVPMADGRLNASAYIDGKSRLQALHDSYAREVSEKFGLVRGKRGSKATHQDQKKFYAWQKQVLAEQDSDEVLKGRIEDFFGYSGPREGKNLEDLLTKCLESILEKVIGALHLSMTPSQLLEWARKWGEKEEQAKTKEVEEELDEDEDLEEDEGEEVSRGFRR